MNSINLRLVQNEENSEDWQTRMLEEVDTVGMTEQEIWEIAITEKIHWAWDFRYGTVCLMAMCCCRWELLVWSRDEDHWHWRDQGTGKRVLNALPTWHKNSLRWWQKLERRKVYMSLTRGGPEGEKFTATGHRSICKLSVSLKTGRIFQKWHQRSCWE